MKESADRDNKGELIRVFVVDDSLFMRRLISDLLESDAEIAVVGTACSGQEALKKIKEIGPDCVTLDLVMPGWDGLTTLKKIMGECPTPVIILSAHSRQDADITMTCINAGAVGVVLKPSGELSLDIDVIKNQLIEQVKALAAVNVQKIKTGIAVTAKRPGRPAPGSDMIIIIGASTGGLQALRVILPCLPADLPVPILVVQHLPSSFFTESMAEHLGKELELEVKIAANDEVVRPGTVYIAPAEFQTTLLSRETGAAGPGSKDIVFRLSKEQPGISSPSIDLTMQSAAAIFNDKVIGVILSGMGEDGLVGIKAIKESGGRSIVQDESSMIFGMPKAVLDAGFADKVLPDTAIAQELVGMVGGSLG